MPDTVAESGNDARQDAIRDNDDVLEQAADWMAAGKKVALATVIGTWGSSPRPVGSQLAVDEDGAFVGSVSGGCIEGAVVGEALASIADGKPRVLDFGVTNEQAWEVGLACGGNIKIFVDDENDPETVNRLINDRPLALVTDLESGSRSIVGADELTGDLALNDDDVALARDALFHDRSRAFDAANGQAFARVFSTPLRLFIVGAVHIAQALVPMAATAGYAITVIDPRGAFATAARFPGVTLSEDWPDDALNEFKPDSRSAVVTLTHDPKLDDPALHVALKSDAFYIGSLGSRRTHAGRLERLAEEGFTEEDVARIHAPVGLPLGATSPAEIAVSILAQIVEAKHKKSDG